MTGAPGSWKDGSFARPFFAHCRSRIWQRMIVPHARQMMPRHAMFSTISNAWLGTR